MHNSTKQFTPKNLKNIMDINSTKESEKLLSFFVNKRTFSSEFDHKGSKKFLNEKKNALKEIVLEDEIDINNIIDKNKYKKKKSEEKENRHRSLKKDQKKNKLISDEAFYFPTFGENEDKFIFYV